MRLDPDTRIGEYVEVDGETYEVISIDVEERCELIEVPPTSGWKAYRPGRKFTTTTVTVVRRVE